jgi:AraC-like DNA-binding protein
LELLCQLHRGVALREPILGLQTRLAVLIPQLFRRHAAAVTVRTPGRPPQRRITSVQDFLHAHFAERVSLDELARLADLSPYHLVRSFCQQIGLPPCQYQVQLRVHHALAQLRKGAPIARAALEAGFVDQSHLNRHLKRLLGITPGQFRAHRKIVQD